MNFTSPLYGVFLLLVVGSFWACRSRRTLRHVLLLIASYVFYGWWNPWYGLLILGSTVLDFVAGARIAAADSQSRRRAWLCVSVLGNLGVLAFFKYSGFFAENVAGLAAWFGADWKVPQLKLLLPVGISFYTFQSMSYTLDIHRGQLTPTARFTDFALFVVFFPQLLAGPIVRAREFLPQLDRTPRLTASDAGEGVYRILRGLVRKIVVANYLAATLVDPVYADPGAYSGGDVFVALCAFNLQIYCDFGGYTDIAIGSARLLGFRLPENFNHPIRSSSPADFWRRWHLTLTSFLRDYLFRPLAGRRSGKLRIYAASFSTLVLCGLWHGAAWHFVFFGAYHGAAIVVQTAWSRVRRSRGMHAEAARGARLVANIVATNLFCAFGAGLFRTPDMKTFGRLLARTTEGWSHELALPGYGVLVCGIAYAVMAGPGRWDDRIRGAFVAAGPATQGLVIAVTLGVASAMLGATEPFIYFQF